MEIPMTLHSFASIAYPTAEAALLAETATWISAGGLNDSSEIAESFAAKSDEALADELLSECEPNADRLDRNDVVAAFARLRDMNSVIDAI
jgi:hypothetical protein